MEAAEVGVGGFSSGESDGDGEANGTGEASDGGEDDELSPLKMPSAGFPAMQPPPSPLMRLNSPRDACADDDTNSSVPNNAFIIPSKKSDLKLPRHDEPQALPPSTTPPPPIHKPSNPKLSAQMAHPPPKIPETDRLGLEAARMQKIDPKRACELHEER